MAEIAAKGEFWLPSEFLPENFFLQKKALMGESKDGGLGDGATGLFFPTDFPYDYDSSNISSSIESLAETESDDEESSMAGLTQQMAHTFFLHNEDNKNHWLSTFPVFSSSIHGKQPSPIACSPQSTLCSASPWSKTPSKISSPPRLYTKGPNKNWEDIPLPAAGAVTGTRLEEEKAQLELRKILLLSNRSLLGAPLKPFHLNSCNGRSSVASYRSSTTLSPQQLQVNQVRQRQVLKQRQQWLRHQISEHGGVGANAVGGFLGNYSNNGGSRISVRSPHSNNGMRAVFLATPSSRKQSCGGTGVFLPRSSVSPTDFHTKPACSTVLLPSRVVQALNLNLDEMVGPHGRIPGGFILDHDTMVARNKQWSQKKGLRPQPPQMDSNQQEHRLPKEWTY